MTETEIEGAAQRMDARRDADDMSFLKPLSEDQREELYAVAWYGYSLFEYDFDWHYDRYLISIVPVEMSAKNVRQGLRRLRAEGDSTGWRRRSGDA